jgi:hypothetical protein
MLRAPSTVHLNIAAQQRGLVFALRALMHGSAWLESGRAPKYRQ